MPSGTVMETFKNLIRHGKHAQQAHKDHHPDQQHAQRHVRDRSLDQQKPARQQKDHQQPQRHQQQHHGAHAASAIVTKTVHATKANTSGQYTREAELIVQEEKAEQGKMPSYKGLENFKLLEKMGDGAFSNVYKALELATGQKVAVKVVRKYELNLSQGGHLHLNARFVKRPRVMERANILKEVQIMRGIDHPSIVKLISFSESDEHYFLVLELMGGGELFHQIVKLTYLSEDLSRHVILQVAHGIRYLHEERGVVHRDIKPENLLFERIPKTPSRRPIRRPYDEGKEDEGEFQLGIGGGEIGKVKIADFGLSKIVWEETTKTPCGTVGYTAPEIVKDERYSKSVDMWALGCVLYTLLCGFPPFYDESINVLTEKVARGYYTFLSPWWDDISHLAKDLITHLLCVDPRQRYTIDEFLAHPWCRAGQRTEPLVSAPGHLVDLRLRDSNGPLDSPLLQSLKGHVPARSPGVAALKEAFDVTYAVHRMEEEGGQRRAKGAGGRGDLGHLNELDEDEGEDDEVLSKVIEKQQQRLGQQQWQQQRRDLNMCSGRAGARDQGSIRRRGQTGSSGHNRTTAFQLDLGNATLLGRRQRASVEPSPLTRGPINADGLQQEQDAVGRSSLGSPMRGVEHS